MRTAQISAIEHHLPERVLSNDELAALFPDWTAARIAEKTGIRERRVVGPDEFASDLAVAAAQKVLARSGFDKHEIDLLVYCTQSPDYFLPTTACVIQDRLGLLPTTATFDYNLGCSAYPYGLAIVRGMVESGIASNALLLTGETYSRFIHPLDKSVRTLFGDAGSATLITATDADRPPLGPFVLGSDGSGAHNLIVKRGAMRFPAGGVAPPESVDASGNVRSEANLYMDGPAIFEFSMRRVPALFGELLSRAGVTLDDLRWVVLHQANEYMLRYLQKKMSVPDEKFALHFAHCGNTVSATIPIVVQHLAATGQLGRGDLIAIIGFGVGYSWGACLIRWTAE